MKIVPTIKMIQAVKYLWRKSYLPLERPARGLVRARRLLRGEDNFSKCFQEDVANRRREPGKEQAA